MHKQIFMYLNIKYLFTVNPVLIYMSLIPVSMEN